MKPSQSLFIPVRGIDAHVRTWGNAASPALFLLHGWMDVGASFQFLVDALQRDWYVIAPDWRGFGRSGWCTDGYWYADYVADLEVIVDRFSPGEPARLVGHSLGGNVVCAYAGIRPQRVLRAVSLDGFGLPVESPELAPEKMRKWLDALRDPPQFATYANLTAVALRLQKNNRRLSREKAEFLASHWAEEMADGSARLLSDPRHKLPFPTLYRIEEVLCVWRRATVPVLWVAGSDSFVRKWLADGEAELQRRMKAFPDCRLVTIENAGHMLHHDQPAAVAAAIEAFLP